MLIEFSKYQGTGNDFVIIDNTTNFFPKTDSKLINFLCDRKIGVGADGLILIEKSKSSDYEMIYFNADGNLGSMCGNGARCSIHFSMLNKIIEHTTSFLAFDGLHSGSLKENFVKVSMSDVLTYDEFNDFIFVDTGSPHLVKCVDDVDQIDIIEISREIQKDIRFKDGVNVNFLSKEKDNLYRIRTYERGVENETLSCGTGAVAAAITLNILSLVNSDNINLKTKGGKLTVDLKRSENIFTNIFLSGNVTRVFDGRIEI